MLIKTLKVVGNRWMLEDIINDEGRDGAHSDKLEGFVHWEEHAINASTFKELQGFCESINWGVPRRAQHVGLCHPCRRVSCDHGGYDHR